MGRGKQRTAEDIRDVAQDSVDGRNILVDAAFDLMSIRVSLAQTIGAGGSPQALIADAGDVASGAFASRWDAGALGEADAGFLTMFSIIPGLAGVSYRA